MNTEKHGFYWATLSYWLIVAILAFLLFFFTGSSPRHVLGGTGGGDGSGYAASGGGDGAGEGNGASLTGTGTDSGESLNAAGGATETQTGQAERTTSVDALEKSGGQGDTPGGNARKEETVAATKKSVDDVGNAPRPFDFSASPGSSAENVSERPAAGGRKKGFFGVEVVQGGRVIFLVDVSGSMGSTANEGYSRMELLKRELQKVIAEMSRKSAKGGNASGKSLLTDTSSGKFRIASFSGNCELIPRPPEKIWSFGNQRDVQNAQKIVSSLVCGGGTGMLQAWQELKKVIAADRITAVYFLSDGNPTDCNETILLDYLKKNHPRLIIHTFSMGSHSPLMEKIAKEHRGRYIEVQ